MGAADFDSWVRTARVDCRTTEWEVFADLQLEEAVEPDERMPAVEANELVRVVADAVGMSVDAVRSRRKQAGHVLARHVVAHCGDQLGLSGTAIAHALGASQQSVSKILTQTSMQSAERDVVDRVLQRLSAMR